ncbi:PREDICTED: uncharacterized protein LOC109212203 [Nicotiana attenuata]|uniref:uncharacterized protein LOC109212203 n=1 Tax=Nicotiana attenuata TaxID=49451 RepID=UPI000904C5E1|nr:PREDICTED: uncharacterized protein LOC109212203 [Nicotiana attenuata]
MAYTRRNKELQCFKEQCTLISLNMGGNGLLGVGGHYVLVSPVAIFSDRGEVLFGFLSFLSQRIEEGFGEHMSFLVNLLSTKRGDYLDTGTGSWYTLPTINFPDKKVTLVHKGSRLLEFIRESASRKTLNWLTPKKVEIILGQSADLNSASGGKTIVADCHFICIGKPNGSTWLKETILKDSLDSHSRLMVDSNLRVKGHYNIFGIRDITDILGAEDKKLT